MLNYKTQHILPKTDDGYSPAIEIPNFPFLGESFNTLFVSNMKKIIIKSALLIIKNMHRNNNHNVFKGMQYIMSKGLFTREATRDNLPICSL